MPNPTFTHGHGTESETCTPPQKFMTGAVSGLMGGVVFGIMMTILSMIGMVAALVSSKSDAVGWVLHLGISVFMGVIFAFLLQDKLKSIGSGLTAGIGYGIFWWVLGALVLMPKKLHMPLFQLNTTTWESLMGHVVFGAILGSLVVLIPNKMRK